MRHDIIPRCQLRRVTAIFVETVLIGSRRTGAAEEGQHQAAMQDARLQMR